MTQLEADELIRMDDVSFVRNDRPILSGINWSLRRDESYVVMGPNGCGKTTLARIAALQVHPSAGMLRVNGDELGTFDVRRRRRRLAFVSSAMADDIRGGLEAQDVVMCAKFAALEPWWHSYTDEDRARARELLGDQGIGDRAGQPFARLSSGERQRCLLARSLMVEPDLLVLDEPNAGLDLAGREDLIASLEDLVASPHPPAVILVTHHVEEIPPSFTNLLAMKEGAIIADGPLRPTLTGELLSECFNLPLKLIRSDAKGKLRWSALSEG